MSSKSSRSLHENFKLWRVTSSLTTCHSTIESRLTLALMLLFNQQLMRYDTSHVTFLPTSVSETIRKQADGSLPPCNVTNRGSGMTCRCNSPKRPPCWNSTSGFDFDHITAVDMSFCTSLRNFILILFLPTAEK